MSCRDLYLTYKEACSWVNVDNQCKFVDLDNMDIEEVRNYFNETTKKLEAVNSCRNRRLEHHSQCEDNIDEGHQIQLDLLEKQGNKCQKYLNKAYNILLTDDYITTIDKYLTKIHKNYYNPKSISWEDLWILVGYILVDAIEYLDAGHYISISDYKPQSLEDLNDILYELPVDVLGELVPILSINPKELSNRMNGLIKRYILYHRVESKAVNAYNRGTPISAIVKKIDSVFDTKGKIFKVKTINDLKFYLSRLNSEDLKLLDT